MYLQFGFLGNVGLFELCIEVVCDSSFLLTVEVELGGEAKIAELDLHFVVEEEVTQL